jgi:hypothetical protein
LTSKKIKETKRLYHEIENNFDVNFIPLTQDKQQKLRDSGTFSCREVLQLVLRR